MFLVLSRKFIQRINEMSHTIAELTAAVAAQKNQIDSVATLVSGLRAQVASITAGKLSDEDQASVDAAFQTVQDGAAELATAIATPGDGTAPAATTDGGTPATNG